MLANKEYMSRPPRRTKIVGFRISINYFQHFFLKYIFIQRASSNNINFLNSSLKRNRYFGGAVL